MSCNHQCLRFGELAVKMGFISHVQLKAALVKQQEENQSNHHRVIGLILFDEGWISTMQIEQVLQGIFLQVDRPEAGKICLDG